MKHKKHKKIIMNKIDDVSVTVFLNYLQKYIASFTAQPFVTQ